MLTSSDIRSKFLQFFESKGHTIVPSSSLVPTNDPTLMFTAAGMVQFKNVFTGAEKRDYTRATSSQRCVRAGGKHNDLENVGHTARHHTFFEMLGNFSFGDYFKEEAIPFAWEFLTSPKWLNISADKLYVTVYHTDDEAYDIWKNNVGLSEERIIRIATDDNFWSAGDTGPCGPCTEIFYDHGDDIWGGLPGTPEEDGDRYIEIWNVVFMQYDRDAEGTMAPLPQTGVDTGCGLERLTAVMQNEHNNYDIDSFKHIINAAKTLANTITTCNPSKENETSFRVVADHLRAMSFLITDGVMPSNEGRGYVLRRIMRRAMRYVTLLGINEPFIYKLVSSLVDVMGSHYGELTRAQKMIEDVVKGEEERFGRTLKQGMKLLTEESVHLKQGDTFSGEIAFKLYDTYGFPLDLTQDALKSRNISVDEQSFNEAMNRQKAKAKAAHKGSGDDKIADVWFDLQETQVPSEFLGYETTETEAQILAIVESNTTVKHAHKGSDVTIITNQTPFYAESGGQVGDTGEIITPKGTFQVTDTQKILDGYFFQHRGTVTSGTLFEKDNALLKVNAARRNAIRKNHSATHLMHAILQDVLGDHVFQKGSLVTDSRLRLDFSHPKALTAEETAEIETRVNALIWANTPVTTKLMDKDAALEAGAMALFGEKYDDDVRVLFMGDENAPASVELCGGTHVNRTADIGLFKIVGESAISAGVRRIEALTAAAAFNYLSAQEQLIKTTSGQLKVAPAELTKRIEALQADIKKLKADLKNAQKGGSHGTSVADMAKTAEDISGTKFVSATLDGVAPPVLREMVDELKNTLGSGVVVLATNNGEKASIVAGVTNDLISKYKAGDLVNAAAATLGGKGGGRPDMAMAGGKAGDLSAAIGAAKAVL